MWANSWKGLCREFFHSAKHKIKERKKEKNNIQTHEHKQPTSSKMLEKKFKHMGAYRKVPVQSCICYGHDETVAAWR